MKGNMNFNCLNCRYYNKGYCKVHRGDVDGGGKCPKWKRIGTTEFREIEINGRKIKIQKAE